MSILFAGDKLVIPPPPKPSRVRFAWECGALVHPRMRAAASPRAY